MIHEYVAVPTEGGGAVSFAVSITEKEIPYDGPVPASVLGNAAKKGKQTLTDGIAIAKEVAQALTRNIDALDEPPDRITAEIGLAVTADADFVVATSSAQAHLVIMMEWNKAHS